MMLALTSLLPCFTLQLPLPAVTMADKVPPIWWESFFYYALTLC